MTASLADPELLLGRWRMSRVVEDRREATRSTISGWLDLTRTADDRIHWAESGRWHRPDADIQVLDRLGHLPMMEDPLAVAQRYRPFLARHRWMSRCA